ncbi:MAG: hypothetical protein GX275_13885 [Clostridiales bacterium]|nr:hypothetical protein [Clostridiales bacterium]
MNIKFDGIVKNELELLLDKSSEDFIRIKVFRGCGRAAYEIYPSFYDEEDDETITIDEIPFVYNKSDKDQINNIKISFDKNKYINGFYLSDIKEI